MNLASTLVAGARLGRGHVRCRGPNCAGELLFLHRLGAGEGFQIWEAEPLHPLDREWWTPLKVVVHSPEHPLVTPAVIPVHALYCVTSHSCGKSPLRLYGTQMCSDSQHQNVRNVASVIYCYFLMM